MDELFLEKIRERLKSNKVIHSIFAPILKVLRLLKRPAGFNVYVPPWLVKQRDSLLSDRQNRLVLNFGGGERGGAGKAIINMDIMHTNAADVVGDGHYMPFKNNSLDFIYSQGVFEHVREPQVVIDEFYRILKPRGKVYTEVPFVCRFHPAARDYWRFTGEAFEVLFKNFKKIKLGVISGPASAFSDILRHFLSVLFCFGSTSLYNIFYFYVFGYLTFFIKYLDFILIRYRTSGVISYGFYYICEKDQI